MPEQTCPFGKGLKNVIALPSRRGLRSFPDMSAITGRFIIALGQQSETALIAAELHETMSSHPHHNWPEGETKTIFGKAPTLVCNIRLKQCDWRKVAE